VGVFRTDSSTPEFRRRSRTPADGPWHQAAAPAPKLIHPGGPGAYRVRVVQARRSNGPYEQSCCRASGCPDPVPPSPAPARTGCWAIRPAAPRANRSYLRRRGIRCTIREQADRVRHRKDKGSAGGRPPAFDWESASSLRLSSAPKRQEVQKARATSACFRT
jgi:hypothetical protein